jgi:hypothetical protein
VKKNTLEIITVGNGNKEYYGNFTKKENQIIKSNLFGKTLHLFSGKSKIGNVRVDYKYGNIRSDVFEYLELLIPEYLKLHNEQFGTVLIDAPYNQKFADKYQKIGNTPEQFIIFANSRDTTRLFKLINEKIKPKRIILKSWNYYVPNNYYLKKGYLCYAGGYRKPTLLLILDKQINLMEAIERE